MKYKHIANRILVLRSILVCISSIALVFFSHAACISTTDTSKFNIRQGGKRQGVWKKKYFLSKKLKSTCNYENGKKSGTRYTYYKSGFLKKYVLFANSRKEGLECFYIDRVRHESKKRCVRYENGKKKETITDFWPNI